MKLLLDTHLLLWAANSPRRLPKDIRELLESEDNELLFSAASIWEVAIKRGLGREDFVVDPGQLRRSLLDNDYLELPINSAHGVAVDRLPAIHRDPFDRILIAQSLVEGVVLLSADSEVAKYGGLVRHVSALRGRA